MSNKFRYAPKTALKSTALTEQIADEKRSQSKSVLNLANVLNMKKTDAENALSEINANTGVFAEQLTPELLKKFAGRVKDIQKKHGVTGGIKPRTVIDRSRRVDIQRAEREIPTVQAVQFLNNGVIRFRTNAGKNSKDTHHIVSVQFLDFQAALNAGKLDNNLAQSILRGAVKFDCDCGRHRYWYRYIATVGGFAYGKPETAFPKIRNPELAGLGCKHVIRVMHSLQSTQMFTGAMKQFISRYRKDPNAKDKTLTKKEIEQAQKQLNKKSAQGKQIRRFKNADQVKKALAEKAKQMKKPKSKALSELEFALNSGAISQDTFNLLIKSLKS